MSKSLKILPVLILLSASTFFVGFYLGRSDTPFPLLEKRLNHVVVNKGSGDREVDFGLFWEVWDLLHEKYIVKNLDSQELVYGAIRGMVQSIGDPYTAFLKPEQNREMRQSLNGKYEGIGAELGMRDEGLIIVAPLEGSPAEGVGVRSGDRILKIDSEDTVGITIVEAVSKIRGPAGEPVVLTLGRKGEKEPIDVTIIRAQITLKSVKWEDKGEGVVYIRLSRFGENTKGDWDSIVEDILATVGEARSIILDLRSNPGGYLNVSVDVASEFVRSGTVVVSQEFGSGEKVDLRSKRDGHFLSVPIVVLINEGSASASEILAAALKEQRQATLIGNKSFGKGTVQDAQDFPDGSGVHITIAKWLTPSGTWINEKGLEVDYEVELAEEDINADRDPQLEKAIEVAKSLQ